MDFDDDSPPKLPKDLPELGEEEEEHEEGNNRNEKKVITTGKSYHKRH